MSKNIIALVGDNANIRTTINNLDNTEKVVHTTHTLGGVGVCNNYLYFVNQIKKQINKIVQ